MSELSNPIFDNEREFLERQKEEYKSALMGDVDQIKTQGQEIGKKAAMAGGVLLAGYLLKRMFSGGKKKAKAVKAEKARKKKKNEHKKPVATLPVSTPVIDYDSIMHEQEDGYTISSERMHHAADSDATHRQQESTAATSKEAANKTLDSPVAKVLTQQAVAFLLVYAGKKLEEYLHGVSENDDIAAKPVVEVTEIETTEYIVPKEDAI
ncbi:hypothetical protein GCM10023188_01930 [Pontibacter saemangeumensis]|uniref:DUF883 domain-containing protein n=1 Tax=Pontibacter saemangeumensis TaxID=1084525 RepID=A0ABP8L6V4_9BACT